MMLSWAELFMKRHKHNKNTTRERETKRERERERERETKRECLPGWRDVAEGRDTSAWSLHSSKRQNKSEV